MAPRLLIIAIMRRAITFLLRLPVVAFSSLEAGQKEDDSASGRAVVREMNLARQNPALYATYLKELRSRINGNSLVLPGGTHIRTREGTGAVDEAIRFLENAQPLAPLAFSCGISRAAAEHCADRADGGLGP